MSEVRTLSLHPLAIHTFIKAQAGSLGKALSEAVMNSLDAFASSVNVTITPEGFVIEDNGQGFRNKDEISAWFETLGFPHDDGNHRMYGKFGMGRAQMWAFARTTWTSNEFVMKVDVQNKGLDYELEITHEPFKGTRIEAEFYEVLPFAKQQQVEIELQNLVKYVPGAVFINEKLASKDPSTEDWDVETPEAWMRFTKDKNAHSLSVYNAGLLVSHFPKYRYGCAGVIVTKPTAALALNIARNEILEAECKVWKAIVKHLPKKESSYKADKPVKASQKELEALGRNVSAGVKTLEKALEEAPNLLISVNGRNQKLSDLVGYYGRQTVVFVPKGDEFGKRLSKLRLATVMARECIANFGCKTAAEFKDLVLKQLEAAADHSYLKRQVAGLKESLWTDDAAAAFPELAAGKKVIPHSELTPAEKCVSIAWQRARTALYNTMRTVTTSEQNGRLQAIHSIAFGDSPLGESAWVDAAAHTWVLNKKDAVDAMSRALPVATKFAMAQLRILCDYLAEGESAGKELFVKVVTETEALGTLMLNLTRFHVYECRNRDVPVQPTRLAELDSLNVE